VTDGGPVYGRKAIEKWYADVFQGWHPKNHVGKKDLNSIRYIGTPGGEIWSNGEWSESGQVKNGEVIPIKGYWSAVDIREGDGWKIRMMTFNLVPAPATTGSQQTNTPDPQLREKLGAAIKKHTDALDKNDAADDGGVFCWITPCS
jgi:hypothetical protein